MAELAESSGLLNRRSESTRYRRFESYTLRMKFVDVASGSIDLVFDGKDARLQFNCSCDDALPYCRAQCCRGRPEWNVPVTARDTVWEDMPLPTAETVDGKVTRVLPVIDTHCAFLDDAARCTTYEARPHGCREWHCSPGGRGENISIRGDGWRLTR